MKEFFKILLVLLSFQYVGYAQMKEIAPFPNESDKLTILKYGNTISAINLKKHLLILASDSLEGRETCYPGQQKAADYIRNHFKTIGLLPPVPIGDTMSYFQHFDLLESFWGKEIYVENRGITFNYPKDFFCLPSSRTTQIEKAELVFAGYGLDDTLYNDYKLLEGFDLNNKILVLMDGTPKLKSKTNTEKLQRWNLNWRNKWLKAKEKGAKGIFIICGFNGITFENKSELLQQHIEKSSLNFPGDIKNESGAFMFLFISPDMAYSLMDINEKEINSYLKKIYKKNKPVQLHYKKPTLISYKIERINRLMKTENVLGYLEGTDKKDEFVIVTAHYDHIGIIDNEIYNGADDDGSGTTAILEIAKAFTLAATNGQRPRRSILFMPVTGEEKGLLGSKYYVNNPIFPLEKTITDLNIDMIGRVDSIHKSNPDYIYLIGSDKISMDLHRVSEDANHQFTNLFLDYTLDAPDDPNRFYYRSDHYNFAEKGIPIIFYFNGVHEDYHQPTDEVQKIDFNKMEKISKLVFYTVWEIANRENRLIIDKK